MCGRKSASNRKHLPEKRTHRQSHFGSTSDDETDNPITENDSGKDHTFVEIIHCRTNESQMPEKTMDLNDVVKQKQNDHPRLQTMNCGSLHYQDDSESGDYQECCVFHNIAIRILKNVSTVICMVYHVILKNNEGKIKIKLRDSSPLFPTFMKDDDKKLETCSFKQYLLRPKMHFHSNIHVYPVSLNNYFDSLTSGVSMPLDESMSNNLLRIYSFNTFPPQVNIFTSLLAKAGFYYTGISDEVRCYACGLTYKNWSSADKPLEIHRRLSPSCSHVIRFTLENESIESDVGRQNTVSSNTSISTLLSVPNTDSTSHLNNLSYPNSAITGQNFPSLSENGSYISSSLRSHVSDTINGTSQSNLCERSPSCAVDETNTPPVNRINTSANGNRQPQLHNGSHDQSCFGASNSQETSTLEINDNGARYPNYGPIQIRISSFQGWPSYLDQTPLMMAKAGFLYAGYNDYTRCFFCGGGLRNWEAGDDPWIEHARWFPNCSYLKENKGERFIKAVQDKQAQLNGDRNQSNGHITTAQKSETPVNHEPSGGSPANHHETIPHLQTVAAKSVLEMGYTEDQVQQAIQKITQSSNGGSNFSAVDILSQLLDDDLGVTHPRQTNVLVPTGNASNSYTISSISTAVANRSSTTDNKTYAAENSVNAAVNGTSSAVNGAIAVENEASSAVNEICQAAVGLENSKLDDTEQLVEENRQLKDQRLCKICLELDASIAFLPCGHIVCCSDCAPAMRKCPICRGFVKGTVKTFLV